MIVRTEALGTQTLVVPEGRLDFGAAAGFQEELERALGAPGSAPAVLVVDCAALEYVSSAGLRALLLAARAAQRAGIRFGLCALRPAVREVLDLSGFSRIIAVHPDRQSALGRGPQAPP
ncbi:MAG TPA: STAS domain-containing protein [Steroidobacteraceae bacterium]|nr:STAS domain-containing protein [Steroidobacteraceae bacterium]